MTTAISGCIAVNVAWAWVSVSKLVLREVLDVDNGSHSSKVVSVSLCEGQIRDYSVRHIIVFGGQRDY